MRRSLRNAILFELSLDWELALFFVLVLVVFRVLLLQSFLFQAVVLRIAHAIAQELVIQAVVGSLREFAGKGKHTKEPTINFAYKVKTQMTPSRYKTRVNKITSHQLRKEMTFTTSVQKLEYLLLAKLKTQEHWITVIHLPKVSSQTNLNTPLPDHNSKSSLSSAFPRIRRLCRNQASHVSPELHLKTSALKF